MFLFTIASYWKHSALYSKTTFLLPGCVRLLAHGHAVSDLMESALFSLCHFSVMTHQFAEVPEHELPLCIITTKQYFYNTSSQGHLILCLGYPLSILPSNVELPFSFVTSRSN